MVSTTVPGSPLKVFIVYSRKDADLKDKLRTRLKPLERKESVDVFWDGKIQPGVDWDAKLQGQLDGADMILLLVSPDLLASDYVNQVELPKAMARHERGKARVIPIIARPSAWQDEMFAKLQVLPGNARPITRWQDGDEAWLDVQLGIYGCPAGY
jgi:hypothetical protein